MTTTITDTMSLAVLIKELRHPMTSLGRHLMCLLPAACWPAASARPGLGLDRTRAAHRRARKPRPPPRRSTTAACVCVRPRSGAGGDRVPARHEIRQSFPRRGTNPLCPAPRGRYPDSVAAYEQALRLRPAFPEALEYLGEAYVMMGRPDDARRVLDRLKPLDAARAKELAEVIDKGR